MTSLVRAIRNGTQDTFNDVGRKIIDRQLNIAPTLTVCPGFPVRVIINTGSYPQTIRSR